MDGKKPRLAIECKWSAEKPDRGIAYLKGKFPELECWQISFEQRPHLVTDTGIHLASADELLGKLV